MHSSVGEEFPNWVKGGSAMDALSASEVPKKSAEVVALPRFSAWW
jgi:hypothetical protein